MYLYVGVFPNNKVYVGITVNFNKRRVMHKSRAKNGYDTYLYNAIRKYGFDNITWNTADGYTDWDDLCRAEIEEIKRYDSTDRNFGYNISAGGDGYVGFKHTDEWKEMMSKRMSGENSPSWGRKLTLEEKQYLSKINTGENNPRFGQEKSEKEKMAISSGLLKYYIENDGKFKDKNHKKSSKDLISKANSGENNGMFGKKAWNNGIKNSEWSEKMKGERNPMYKIGENHPMFGKKHSKQTIKEMSGSNNSQAKLIEMDVLGIREKYKSKKYKQKDLAKEYKISITNISNIVNNKIWKKNE